MANRAFADLFNPVVLNRMSEVIVEQVRLLIRQGTLHPGDRLPAERELCDRFGVSRVTVREALRMLEARGLIEIKMGPRGGAFVTTPTRGRVGEGIADYLKLSAVTAADATEARKVIELGIIPLVCERATVADLDDLDTMCADAHSAVRAGRYDMSMSAAFHSRVAACTHNGAVELIVASFQGPLRMSLEEAHNAAPQMGPRGVDEHEAFTAAVRRQDIAAATAIMGEHLDRTARRLRREEGAPDQ